MRFCLTPLRVVALLRGHLRLLPPRLSFLLSAPKRYVCKCASVLCVCMCVYMYVCVCVHACVYVKVCCHTHVNADVYICA